MADHPQNVAATTAGPKSANRSFLAGLAPISPALLDVTTGAEAASVLRNRQNGPAVLHLSRALSSSNTASPSEASGQVAISDEDVSSTMAQARSSPGSELNPTQEARDFSQSPHQQPNGTANMPTRPEALTHHVFMGMTDHHPVPETRTGHLEIDDEETVPAARC